MPLRIPHLCVATSTAVALTACITEQNVDNKFARTWCDRYQECDRGDFEERYTSYGDCVDSNSDGEFVGIDFECFTEAGCEFQPDRAAACRAAAAEATCSEFTNGEYLDDCQDIWICSDGQTFDQLRCQLSR